jgi:LysR family hydrogen peroxide-inducible transcriptional activator
MNIQQFKYILAVAEYRHFELAAEKCFVTQSTLSTMISKFEDELGIQVFDRKKKPVGLTNEGELIIDQLKIILNNIDQLDELKHELKGEVKGKLTMAVIPTIAPFLLPLFLQDFANRFPDLVIEVRELTTKEILRQLKSRELDIGILSTPINDSEIKEVDLYEEPFVLYDRALKYPDLIAPEMLDLGELWLMEEGHCFRTQVLKLCDINQQLKKSNLNFDFKAGSIDSLLRFVRANRASTLLPYLATTDFDHVEKCFVKKFEEPIPTRKVGIVVHQYFVKTTVLSLLKSQIELSVMPLLINESIKTNTLNPM